MSTHHLSELSVQLRKLQNENNAQASEIDRLERQIRILSELKGVSIQEIRDSLRTACEGEAHGELRAVVDQLQAKVNNNNLQTAVDSGGGGRTIQSDRVRLALELRVGELEELETTYKSNLYSLYEQVAILTESNTSLKTKNLQLEECERRLKAKEEEEIKKSSIVAVPLTSSVGSYNYSEFAIANTQASMVDQNRLLAAETLLAGEKEQRSLLQSQMESTNKSYQLKIDQCQHRVQFLEGQITDLEQQMNSLYVAFDMMQTDRSRERETTLMWKNNLLQSDAALAMEHQHQHQHRQQPLQSDSPSRQQSTTPIRASHSSYSATSNRVSLPSKPRHNSTPQAQTSVKPSVHPPIIKGNLLLLLDNHYQPLQPQRKLTPSASQSKRKLLIKTPSQRRLSSQRMKKQYCVLHGSNGLYQLRYGDSYNSPCAGVHEFLTTGVSTVEHTERSSRFDYGFEIVINPSEDSPSLCCAAEGEGEFMNWMRALDSILGGMVEDNHRVEC